jgi:hypothetical protein
VCFCTCLVAFPFSQGSQSLRSSSSWLTNLSFFSSIPLTIFEVFCTLSRPRWPNRRCQSRIKVSVGFCVTTRKEYVQDALIIIMFLLNLNMPRPSQFITRFSSLILMLPLFKSFLAPKILIPQFGKYYTLLRFSICVSLFVSVAQISVLLLKPNGLASPLAMLIASKDAGVYVPAVKSSIDLAICVLASVLNSVLSCLIGDRFFLFGCTQR